MNIAALIVPLDPTAATRATEVASVRHSRLAHLTNEAFISKADKGDIEQLHCGSLTCHRLGGFRDTIHSTLLHNPVDEKTVIADDLMALTLQTWATTLHPAKVLLVHSGKEELIAHLMEVLAVSPQIAEAMSESLIDDLAHCTKVGAIVDTSKTSIAEALSSSPAKDENRWEAAHAVVTPTIGHIPKTRGLWVAWQVLSRRYKLNYLSERIIKERNQYRAQEIASLKKSKMKPKVNAIESGTVKVETTEPFVKPLGRRFRYAIQMIRDGEISWKYGAKKSKVMITPKEDGE